MLWAEVFSGLWMWGRGRDCLLCGKVCFLAPAWPPSLQNVEESLRHVDATFFLGKVGFLVTGGK